MGSNPLPRGKPSASVPYIPGEPWHARHERRRTAAEEQQDEVARWAHNKGIAVTVGNEGHHWTFKREGRVCEWWPSSGRFVAGRKYQRPRKVYDVDQAKAQIGRALLGGRDGRSG